jgi:hypothetical protein
MIYLLSMKELIRKVLTESREVKTGDFTGLEKVIVNDAKKLIKDYPYLDSVYGVNDIEVVDNDLEGRVLIKLKPELNKYFNKSRSDYDEVNNFYIYYSIQVYHKLPKELFETADIYTFEDRLEDMLETKLGLNTKKTHFNVYFVIPEEDMIINESDDKHKNKLSHLIDKIGLLSASQMTGIHPNKLISMVGESGLTNKVMINYIQDVIKETGGFSLIEYDEDPILYGSNENEVREINFLGMSSVIVDVYDYDLTKHLGEFRVLYLNLPDDIIEKIYNVVIDVYNENIK